jgi:cytochrome c553
MRASAIALVTVAVLMATGCRVSNPGSFERSLMTNAKHKITVGSDSKKNPRKGTPQDVTDGREAFSHYCVSCHGLDGQNTGVPFAEKMSPPVPSLASTDVQSYSDGQLKWIIDNGVSPSGMPASKGTLSDDEIWSIVVYLRHLPPAGSLGEPCFYSGECPPPEKSKTGDIQSQGAVGKSDVRSQ